jgi:uncharacterized membrane protein
MRSVLGSIVLVGNLVACSAATTLPVTAPINAPTTARPPAVTAAVAPPPVQDAPANLPDRFLVSTQDPAWSARVEGVLPVVLEGPGGLRRVLRVERHDAVFDGRYVQARDATGMVEIRITPRLCLDRASTQHEYTARLTIEGAAPVLGCGQRLP